MLMQTQIVELITSPATSRPKISQSTGSFYQFYGLHFILQYVTIRNVPDKLRTAERKNRKVDVRLEKYFPAALRQIFTARIHSSERKAGQDGAGWLAQQRGFGPQIPTHSSSIIYYRNCAQQLNGSRRIRQFFEFETATYLDLSLREKDIAPSANHLSFQLRCCLPSALAQESVIWE